MGDSKECRAVNNDSHASPTSDPSGPSSDRRPRATSRPARPASTRARECDRCGEGAQRTTRAHSHGHLAGRSGNSGTEPGTVPRVTQRHRATAHSLKEVGVLTKKFRKASSHRHPAPRPECGGFARRVAAKSDQPGFRRAASPCRLAVTIWPEGRCPRRRCPTPEFH